MSRERLEKFPEYIVKAMWSHAKCCASNGYLWRIHRANKTIKVLPEMFSNVQIRGPMWYVEVSAMPLHPVLEDPIRPREVNQQWCDRRTKGHSQLDDEDDLGPAFEYVTQGHDVAVLQTL